MFDLAERTREILVSSCLPPASALLGRARWGGCSGHEVGFSGSLVQSSCVPSFQSNFQNNQDCGCSRLFHAAAGCSYGLRRGRCEHRYSGPVPEPVAISSALTAKPADHQRCSQSDQHYGRTVDDAFVERHACDVGLGGSGNRKCRDKRKHLGFACSNHHLSFHRDREWRQCDHGSHSVRERCYSESHANANSASTQPFPNTDSTSTDADTNSASAQPYVNADTTSANANPDSGYGLCERYDLAYG